MLDYVTLVLAAYIYILPPLLPPLLPSLLLLPFFPLSSFLLFFLPFLLLPLLPPLLPLSSFPLSSFFSSSPPSPSPPSPSPLSFPLSQELMRVILGYSVCYSEDSSLQLQTMLKPVLPVLLTRCADAQR